MWSERSLALIEALEAFDRVVEVGIGTRPAVAAGLAARGCAVIATDLVPHPVPSRIQFEVDDIVDPTIEIYADADCIYGLNLPPELHRPAQSVANRVGADFRFTTVGTEPPTVPARPTTIGDTTLYVGTPIGSAPTSDR